MTPRTFSSPRLPPDQARKPNSNGSLITRRFPPFEGSFFACSSGTHPSEITFVSVFGVTEGQGKPRPTFWLDDGLVRCCEGSANVSTLWALPRSRVIAVHPAYHSHCHGLCNARNPVGSISIALYITWATENHKAQDCGTHPARNAQAA